MKKNTFHTGASACSPEHAGAFVADKNNIRVLFVCLGNICRSPAAQGVLQSIVREHGDEHRWHIDSAGIGSWHTGQLPDKRMRVHAGRRGYDLTHHARQVRATDFEDFDLIIAMDSANAEDLRELAPTVEDTAKIVPMIDFCTLATNQNCVPDPYYEGAEGFELVLDMLENACANLYTALTASK